MESFTLHWTLYRSLKAKEDSAFQRKDTAEMKARMIESEQHIWGTITKFSSPIGKSTMSL